MNSPDSKDSIFADAIASACCNAFAKLPKRAKPVSCSSNNKNNSIVKEWTVLSGICLERCISEKDPLIEDSESEQYPHNPIQVVALGTGVKCLNRNQLSSNGEVVFDMHAEVMAKRNFQRFLNVELNKLLENKRSDYLQQLPVPSGNGERTSTLIVKLKDNFKIHLYVSCAPCGDGSMDSYLSNVEDSQLRTHPLFGVGIPLRKTKRPKLEDEYEVSQEIMRGRSDYSRLGILRTKPARADAVTTLSMSCSDKLARWNVLGLQSSSQSIIFHPIYLSSIIVGRNFHHQALQRALNDRISNIKGLPSPYHASPISIMKTSINFEYDKTDENVNWKTCSSATGWILGDTSIEVLVQGRKLGASKGKNGVFSSKTRSAVCKKAMVEMFLPLALKSGFPDHTIKDYSSVKNLSPVHRAAKEIFFASDSFKDWIGNGIDVDSFNIK